MNLLTLLVRWLARIVEEGSTGRPSVKRFGFALCVTVLSAVIALFGGVMGGVAWMAHGSEQAIELVRILANSLEVVAGLVLAAVTTGYVGGKAVERPRKDSQSREEAERP